MQESYLTVKKEGQAFYEVEHSKFIAYVRPVNGEEEAKAFIAEIRKKNFSATHNVYAYIADEYGREEKFSDDSEPQGTAGFAVLSLLKNKKLKKTAVVVTRYFGGIKLGTGGLKRAYETSAALAIDFTGIAEVQLANVYTFHLSYDEYSKLANYVANRTKYKYTFTEVLFGEQVKLSVAVSKEHTQRFSDKVRDMFGGTVQADNVTEEYIAF